MTNEPADLVDLARDPVVLRMARERGAPVSIVLDSVCDLLDVVRQSGVINMFEAPAVLEAVLDVDRATSHKLWLHWVQTFSTPERVTARKDNEDSIAAALLVDGLRALDRDPEVRDTGTSGTGGPGGPAELWTGPFRLCEHCGELVPLDPERIVRCSVCDTWACLEVCAVPEVDIYGNPCGAYICTRCADRI